MLLYKPMLSTAEEKPQPLRMVAFGNSLTAGYGLLATDAFPAVLQRRLQEDGLSVSVINAGVSGDTTEGGLARLEWVLGLSPDLILIELGANDALRGLDPARAKANLDRIIERIKQENIRSILAGMKAPRNMGRAYVEAFDRIYPELAQKHDIPLYPFFLEGVAGQPSLNLPDGIHPNAQGIREIVKRIAPFLLESVGE